MLYRPSRLWLCETPRRWSAELAQWERIYGSFAEMPHSSADNVKGIKSAIHLSETALDTYGAPPRLGEHTGEVLTSSLGYSSEDVLMLGREGVI